MTEAQARKKYVDYAVSYLGCKESDGSHKKIIDLYNSHKPLARGYPMKYDDAWCACFVSAMAIGCDMSDIIPLEVGCGKYIELAKKAGIWVENDAYVPKKGDLVLYDWQDGKDYAATDNTGSPDHIGIVVSVSGKTIKVIEGNMSNAVGYRNLEVNGRYIRGFVTPKFGGTAAKPDTTDAPAAPVTGTVSTGSTADEKAMWSYLFSKIGNEFGVAGLMANIYPESALRSDNLQNSYESKLGYTDASYTAAVDSGKYDNFAHDNAGYGLCQWTFWSRKEALLAFAKAQKRSIGDWRMQLDYLMKELSESYTGVLKVLKTATSVKQASDVVLTQFERPADQSTAAKNRRANFGQRFYNAYGSGKTTTAKPTTKPTGTVKVDYAQKFDKSIAGSYKVTASSGLHIRAGANTSKTSLDVLPCGTMVRNYGYYSTATNGVRWLYVQTADGMVGFCSADWLKKC